MRYAGDIVSGMRLRTHARRVADAHLAPQSQESLDDQLKDLAVLANRFGLYDAHDWLERTRPVCFVPTKLIDSRL